MTKNVTDRLRDLIRRYAGLHSTVCSKSESSCLTSMDYKQGHVLKSWSGQRVHPQQEFIPSTKTSSNSILFGANVIIIIMGSKCMEILFYGSL